METPNIASTQNTNNADISSITFKTYTSESELDAINKLMLADLSEPYSIYTYRYFINGWPKLCWMAMDNGECIGAVVCKVEVNKQRVYEGYIAMLAIKSTYRGKGLGTLLVEKAIETMRAHGCSQVYLETEVVNLGALRLYEKLGFIRTKRLFKYYLNGNDAFKLLLSFPYELDSEILHKEAERLQIEAKKESELQDGGAEKKEISTGEELTV
jgi:peptide alpha-N-acetyltransferase